MTIPSGGGTTFPSNNDMALSGPHVDPGATVVDRYDGVQIAPFGGSIPAGSGTVTGPPAFGAAPVAGVAATYSKGDHIHGLPAAPTPTSPLTGTGGTGDATGGVVSFDAAAGAAGGAGRLAGGHANTHSDRTGGEVNAEPGTAFFGAAEIRSGSTGTPHAGPNFVRVEGNDTDAVRIVSQNGVVFITGLPAADPGVPGRLYRDAGGALFVSL